MDAYSALVASGKIKLEAEGFLVSVCTEQEIESVESLTRQEMNALKMVVRQKRQAGVVDILITVYWQSFNLDP
jgi:predicted nucleic acid-binding protein